MKKLYNWFPELFKGKERSEKIEEITDSIVKNLITTKLDGTELNSAELNEVVKQVKEKLKSKLLEKKFKLSLELEDTVKTINSL
jgi:hypothetical protein